MMGRKGSTGKLFYNFSLEDRVPTDHLLRRVSAAVDFSFVRRLTKRFYSHTGQPSIDPVVLFKMALVGYLYGITSERRLVQEIQLNLAYLWFIGYDLDETVPDHSVLSKARRRFGPTVYLGFFTEIVRQCDQAGLIRGNKLYVDSTLVAANADADSLGSRALIAQLPEIGQHVTHLWQDNPEASPASAEPVATPTAPSDPADGSPDPATQADGPRRTAVSEETGGTPRLHVAGPGDTPTKPRGLLNERQVSRVDPAAELVQRARVPAGLYYKVHAGVDAGRARIVTAVEVTGGGIADEHLLERLIHEHEGAVGRSLQEVVADAKYGTVDNYRRLEAQGIRASIPLHETSAETRAVPSHAFEYEAASDSFICPNGQHLVRQGRTTTTAAHPLIIYRARRYHCRACPDKAACCGEGQARSISRPDDDGLRDRTRAYLATFAARQSIRRRKVWIETLFGDGKERRGLRRAQWWGLDWMRIQAWMIATAQNVRQLALRTPRRPVEGVGALEKGSRVSGVALPLSLRCLIAIDAHYLPSNILN